jgi:hypothetical protein
MEPKRDPWPQPSLADLDPALCQAVALWANTLTWEESIRIARFTPQRFFVLWDQLEDLFRSEVA